MRFSHNRKKGFTLLELLVVIAIIGILSAVVVMSLDQSKDKGGDAGVKNNLTNSRSQAEVFYINSTSNPKSYVGICSAGTNSPFRQIQAAARAYGKTPKVAYNNVTPSTWNTEECHATASAYAIWVPLRESRNGAPVGWCIDSTNTGKKVTAVLNANATQCP